MPCVKCINNPDYHSFKKFGKLQDKNLFYTAPAKTDDYNEDGTKLTNIKIHVKEDTLNNPWIWVLDCQKMRLVHYTEMSFNIGLLQLLNVTETLDSVWIMNPNIWIYTTGGKKNATAFLGGVKKIMMKWGKYIKIYSQET